jgi:hypothetical protein
MKWDPAWRRSSGPRGRLERLCGYAVRAPFALQRLSQSEDGQLVYRMKRPRGDRLKVITDDAVAGRILLPVCLDSRGPSIARAQAPPDFSEPVPTYDGADTVYAD